MLEKLNGMIKDRYGKGFSIRKLAAVDADASTEMVIRGDDLYVPIFVKDIFLGFGMVHKATDLSTDQHAHLTKLIRMILEPELYSQHLERTIHNLEVEKTISTETQRVQSKLIFLFGHNASRVQKIGMEVHEISENWSFLPFQDIANSTKSAADFQELNGTTLVVNLELGLSADHQKMILEYVTQNQPGALLIFTASRPSYQLLEAGLISENLHEFLKNHEFSVDRLPVDKAMLKDVLEMMYFESQT